MTHAPPVPLAVHVVSHTHWDREWYLPAGRFRQRLVPLMDELLDTPSSPEEAFLLDGQAVVLEDYLAVRPGRRALLAERLRDGSLEAGPWYVLADEFIPSGEALVRNLLAGRATLHALGAEPPPVLYSPDAFGHPAVLPTIAAGFGLPVIILWRGYGGPAWPSGDVARWRAHDGSEILLYHLPPDGYEFGANLPADDSDAGERWGRMRDVLGPRATLGITLLLNGADHHARQPGLARAVAALARAAAPARVQRSSLGTFAREIERRARDARLPLVEGELRDSYGYTWTLQGTFGSRADLKRRNAHAERLLLRDSEPWNALAARSDARGAPGRRALLHAAWKELLLCHPHDTLCGCSVDDVARAMDARLDDVEAQGHGLRDDALAIIAGHDPARARAQLADWRPVILVRNAAPRPRAGVAELDVLRFRRHVAVGPGSGAPLPDEVRETDFSLNGGAVRFQLLDDRVRHDRIESPLHYPYDDLVDAARVVAWVEPVMGYGITALTVDPPVGASEPGAGAGPVRTGDHWIDNGALRVEVGVGGVVRLESGATGATIPSLIDLEDVGDVGDLYTHSPRLPAIPPTEFLGARVVHAGPLRGELRAAWRLDVPAWSSRERRSAEVEPCTVHVALTLDAGSPVLRVRVWGENRARDHRLRVVFSTGLAGAATWADAAFGPVCREPIQAPAESAEAPPATAPLARYVSRYTAERGVTIYSDGLAEYEAKESGCVAITLLRAVGELSRADLPERPGHAGWPSPTPGAQSPGHFEGCFAILPHGPRDAATMDLVERVADDVLLPLRGVTLRSALAIPRATLGVELEGAGLAFSSCKESEDGEWLVVRCVNVTDHDVEGRWRVAAAPAEAWLARLDESLLSPLTPVSNVVSFRVPPRAVITILMR